MVSGYLSIKEPGDIEKAIAKMLNKILLSEDPLLHAQKFASLANSWVNCRRLNIDLIEVEQFKEELSELRKQITELKNGPVVCMESP